jgi:hypothetical protein
MAGTELRRVNSVKKFWGKIRQTRRFGGGDACMKSAKTLAIHDNIAKNDLETHNEK